PGSAAPEPHRLRMAPRRRLHGPGPSDHEYAAVAAARDRVVPLSGADTLVPARARRNCPAPASSRVAALAAGSIVRGLGQHGRLVRAGPGHRSAGLAGSQPGRSPARRRPAGQPAAVLAPSRLRPGGAGRPCLINPSHVNAFALPPEVALVVDPAATSASGQMTSPFQGAYFKTFGLSPAAL